MVTAKGAHPFDEDAYERAVTHLKARVWLLRRG